MNTRPKSQPEPSNRGPAQNFYGPSNCIAAIDVGSSATRLVIARPEGVRLLTLARSRYAVRLGTEAFAGGRIGALSIAQLGRAFIDMAARLRAHRVVRYTAVGTSALRDAANADAVVAALHAQSGLQVQIISGAQEAALMREALLTAYGRSQGTQIASHALLLDLGGGSLELMRADGSGGSSLPLGTVRLLARYPELRGPMTAEAVHALAQALTDTLAQQVGPQAPAGDALGTGGNVEAMAAWLGGGNISPLRLPMAALLPAACTLGPLDLAERGRAYGLHPPSRADLLLPALLIMHAVGRHFGVERMVVPGAGIRDALLAHLAAALAAGA